MNQKDLHIDELLNGYIDGELTEEQQAEVKEQITRNPQVGRRLRQLEKCRMLLTSIPRAEAPAGIADRVKAALDRTTRPEQEVAASVSSGNTHIIMLRKVLTAAAVIAVMAILSVVINMLAFGPDAAETPVAPVPGVAASKTFTGKLELQTGSLVRVDAFINRAVQENGLSPQVSSISSPNKRVYSLSCTKECLNRLLADLQSVWDKLDGSQLFVDTEEFGKQVTVAAVTAEQVAEVVNQPSAESRMEVARDFATLNSMADELPGKEIFAAMEGQKPSLTTIPKPFFTGPIDKPQEQAPTEEQVHLSIVLTNTK
jgi:hypothetical protein